MLSKILGSKQEATTEVKSKGFFGRFFSSPDDKKEKEKDPVNNSTSGAVDTATSTTRAPDDVNVTSPSEPIKTKSESEEIKPKNESTSGQQKESKGFFGSIKSWLF